MFGGVLGSLKIPVIADLKQFEEGIAKAELQAKAGGSGIGGALKGGIGPAMIGAAAGIGLATIAIKSMMEISDKWEASQKGLEQALGESGDAISQHTDFINNFIQSNRKFVTSQSEVVDSYAALTREGLSRERIQEDLNLALDLSTIKNINLKDATTLLQQVEMGRGRALIPLGISMKEYPVLTESAVQAAAKLATAEKAVEKATAAHTAAVKAHGPASAAAHASAKLLKEANDKLAVAHNYAAERAKASAEIHDILHQKLDGGRKTTSDLKQATNDLGNTWQSFSQTHGPAFLKIFTTAIEILNRVADAIGVVLAKSLDLQNAIGKAFSTPSGGRASDPITATRAAGKTSISGHLAGFGRAAGGSVGPHGDYVVGELGPEILHMGSQGGTVIPNGAGGGGITLIQHIHGNLMTERQTLQWARDGIRRLDRAQS